MKTSIKNKSFLAICCCIGLTVAALPAISSDLVYPDVHVQLTELDSTPLRLGQHVSIQNLARIKAGLSVHELESILGRPFKLNRHKDNVDFDYNITFHIAGGPSEVICQFKVIASSEGMVSSTHWRRNLCETLFQKELGTLAPATAVAAPAPSVIEQTAATLPEVINREVETISGDVAFAFGSAELTAQGCAELDVIADRLISKKIKPSVLIIGHADRIGTLTRKLARSTQRAEAVRSYLAAKGFPQDLMQAEGRGDREPLVECDRKDSQELKNCLKPNRRVEIKILQ